MTVVPAFETQPLLPQPAPGTVRDLSCCLGKQWEVDTTPRPVRRRLAGPGLDDGLQRLLTATQTVTAAGALTGVLSNVVRAAVQLVGATGATLALVDEDGRLRRLVEVGTRSRSRQEACAASADPVVCADHRPAVAMIDVPVLSHSRLLSHLYVTGPRADAFGVEDEEVLLVFAAVAASAIDAALQLDESGRHLRWKQASARITTALLSETDSPEVLRMVMAEGRRLVDADDVSITRPVADGEQTLRALAAVGELGGSWDEDRRPLPGSVTEFVCTSGLILSEDLATDQRLPSAGVRHPGEGPLLAVPITTQGATPRVLVLTRHRGRAPFSDSDQTALSTFLDRVTLALDLARGRVATERAHLLEERDRIARDMHDHVIGRLFGTGMALQGLSRWMSDPAGLRHLAAQTDNLDAAIGDLRTLIYGLDRDPRDVWSVGARLQQVIDETTPHLGFTPTLTVDPGLDLPPGSATPHNLLAVLREALANVARHSGASAVRVSLTGGTCITLTVADNGLGLPQTPSVTTSAGGHGLANMRERAHSLGGTASTGNAPGGGAVLCWTVPNPT